MSIKELVDKKDIIFSDEITDKKDALYFLANHLYTNKVITDIDEFIKEVYRREEVGPTGFGKGVAIPHAKSNVINETNLTILKLNKAIKWESIDSGDVNIIFLISVPEKNANQNHLRMLSKIAERLVDDEFISDLLKSNTSEEILKIL